MRRKTPASTAEPGKRVVERAPASEPARPRRPGSRRPGTGDAARRCRRPRGGARLPGDQYHAGVALVPNDSPGKRYSERECGGRVKKRH